jgi:hypothetical protein
VPWVDLEAPPCRATDRLPMHARLQDVGAVVLARRVAPNLPIHASTQMSITSAEGAEFAARERTRGEGRAHSVLTAAALLGCWSPCAPLALHHAVCLTTHPMTGLGVTRVVVGRELSVNEIAKV